MGEGWWPNLKFKIFGEWKMFYWLFGFLILLMVAGLAVIGYILFHFIAKYW